MTIVGARIDNRLLHGIVATQWAPQSGATRVMVIDNEVANDPIIKESMKLARPSGMAISIITEEVALNNFKAEKYDNQKVFIVSKTPGVFLELVKQGTKIDRLILGGTLTAKDEIKVTNRAYILKNEVEIYKELHNLGTKVFSAYTPNDDQVDVLKILNKKN